jgi:hypothetical protein
MNEYTHRRDAKNAKFFIVYVKEFLCALSAIAPCIALSPASLQSCVSAVKPVFWTGILIKDPTFPAGWAEIEMTIV